MQYVTFPLSIEYIFNRLPITDYRLPTTTAPLRSKGLPYGRPNGQIQITNALHASWISIHIKRFAKLNSVGTVQNIIESIVPDVANGLMKKTGTNRTIGLYYCRNPWRIA